MFGSVNQSTQTYRAHRLLYGKAGHSTVLTLCVLYHIHTFLNWRNIISWIPFGSDLDPNRVCKERERERDWCRHVKVNIASTDRQVGRERERCVCSFWISSVCLFFTLETRPRILKFCVDLCKKIWSYDMSSGINSWVQSRTQNYWVRGTILAGIRSWESEQKRGRTK